MSIASSLSSRRKEFVDASLLRISVSLCWISGWSRTWTLLMALLWTCHSGAGRDPVALDERRWAPACAGATMSEDGAVGNDTQRRKALAMFLRERAARGPGAAFEHPGQRHVTLVHVHAL